LGGATLVAVVGVGLGLDRVRQLAEREVDDLVLALVQHVELHRSAGRETADGAGEFAGILDRLAVDRRDDVAGFDAGLGRRTIGLRFGNQRAFGLLQAEAVGDVGVTGWIWTPIQPRLTEPLSLSWATRSSRVGRDRERDADAAAGRRIDRGVDAHHLAVGVEGRAAGVALVHGRVDLDEVVIRAVADVAAAAETMPAVTVPPRPNGLPTASTQSPIRGLPSESLANGKSVRPSTLISASRCADRCRSPCGVGLAVVGRDFDLVGAVDHVIVGHGIAVGEMKKPEPWPVTAPRPRAVTAQARGQPSGPPKRRKKRSIGEPGWNGESSLLALSSLATFSLMLTFTEITDGFTRSTMSAKPTGFSTLRTSLLTCACAALLKMSTGPGDGLKP
jgi:hypothetical protein